MTCDMCAMGQNRQNSLEHNESGYSSIADVRADLDRRWWLCANCRRDSGRQKDQHRRTRWHKRDVRVS